MSGDLKVSLSPTQAAFVQSDAHICLFIGPMGEGKTHAGVFGLIAHAARCGRPIRCALIRDTHQNIKTSTAPDIMEILGPFVTFHDDNKKFIIKSTPRVECDCFGIDDPASLSKLQGPQYACVWLEEPAPIIEKTNAGLPRSVFEMAVARAARQRGTRMRVQITQNPADEDHWTADLASGPRIFAELEGVQILKETFRIPRGENKYLNPLARAANVAAFQNDPGKMARYVEGREAPVLKGKNVAAGYSPGIHFTTEELPLTGGGVGIRGWDGWHHPCCVIGEFIRGQFIIHDVVYEEGMGVRELIPGHVLSLLESAKYRDKMQGWRDIGDPSMLTPDQSTRSESAAKAVERLLKTRFEPGPTRWETRRDAIQTVFQHGLLPDGRPKIRVSGSARLLHRALNGGWHYKIDNSGKITGNLPVKDAASNVGDAFSYPVTVLFPADASEKARQMATYEKYRKMAMNRAMSYGGGPQKSQMPQRRVG